jgi:hypothetical protein
MQQPLLQAFPFPSTLGEVTLHQLSQACVFIYSSHGKWVFSSPVEFSSHCHFYKLSGSWLLGMCRRSCLLQLACCEGFPLPPSSALRAPCSLCYVSFLLLLFIIQFFFLFSLGRGRSVQGAMLIWPRVVCGSTLCHLAHLVVHVFPSSLGAGHIYGFMYVSHTCIPGMKLIWSLCMMFLTCCQILFVSILLKIFASIFIKDIGL